MRKIEVCCCTMHDVIAARDGGACRVELCSALESGGLTPSAGLIVGAVRERSQMAVNVLVRPRGGDFVYNTRELAVMEADIEAVRAAGAQGVVIGALTAAGEIDVPAMERLLSHCEGLDVTFHRAFDECADPSAALEQLISLGIPRLLTSGCQPDALKGAPLIADLVKQAANRIIIMPGAGINANNISEIERITGAEEFHSTCTDKSVKPPHTSPLFGSATRPTDSRILAALTHN